MRIFSIHICHWPVIALLIFTAFQTYVVSANEAQIAQGKNQYLLNCAGCHRKDLKGAVGFNLRDGEWVHGGSPAQILHSINRGFSAAGMPGFGPLLSEDDRLAIVAFILSEREGFENLTYRLYQLDSEKDVILTADKAIKSGPLKNNFMDFDLPEVSHYGLVFEGYFYAPDDDNAFLFAEGIKDFNIEVLTDGEPVKPQTYGGVQRWKLKKSKQLLSFSFISADSRPSGRNINLFATSSDGAIKLFPVSTRAVAASKTSQFDVKATNHYVVQRKKIIKLPAYSVAVGAPSKLNYAFNTRSCAINGLWQGDMLDIGPNIGGRGKDGSIPLGDWVYHYPAQLVPELAGESSCQFRKYRINNSAPTFYFAVNNIVLSLINDFSTANEARFIYNVIENPDELISLTFSLPGANNIQVSSEQGTVAENKLSVNIGEYSNFSVQLAWK